MEHTLTFVSKLPDPVAFEALMRAYYRLVLDKLRAAGGPDLSAETYAADTLAHMGDLLPPNGRTLLATGADGALLGCGVIRKVRADAAELKRLYVCPQARGLGLGQRIFEMRVAEARRMGCRTLYADTVKHNRPMLSIYERNGFEYIPRYPENANPPELAPYLVYLSRSFPQTADPPLS